jgi:hypothetical protein
LTESGSTVASNAPAVQSTTDLAVRAHALRAASASEKPKVQSMMDALDQVHLRSGG